MAKGTARKTREGVYELRVYAGGRQRSRTIHATRQKDVDAALRAFQAEADAGKNAGSDETFAAYLADWLAFIEPKRSPMTIHGYRWRIDKHIVPAFGSKPLWKVKAEDLDRFYSSLTARGLAATSVRQYHAIIRAALNQAVKWDRLTFNPAHKATPPDMTKREIEPPSRKQVKALMDACEQWDWELSVFYKLAAMTGMRRGELCALRWRDIDVDKRRIRIAHSIAEVGKIVLMKETKGKQVRRFDMEDPHIALLRDYREWLKGQGRTVKSTSYIFSHDLDGARPWRPAYTTTAWTRLREKLDLPDVRLHDLRHYQATIQFEAGTPPTTVSRMLGHAQVSTTFNMYGHSTDDADRQAAKVAGDAI